MSKIEGINLMYINRLSDGEKDAKKVTEKEYSDIISKVHRTEKRLNAIVMISITVLAVIWAVLSSFFEWFPDDIVPFITCFLVLIFGYYIGEACGLDKATACNINHIPYGRFREMTAEYDILKTQIEIENFLDALSSTENELICLTTEYTVKISIDDNNEEEYEINVEWKFADAKSGDVSTREYKWIVKNVTENNKVTSYTLDVSKLKLLIPINRGEGEK